MHGLGTALPERVVSNRSVAERLGVNDEWIVQRLGIHYRHVLGKNERLTDLAAVASKRALEDAGVDPEDLDLVVAATTTQDELLPNMAPLVATEIGARGVGGFDVGAACTGFLSGLSVAAGQIESGRAEAVLVVGTDCLSRYIDPDDRSTAAVFGDGAGAVVLQADDEARIGPCRLWTDAHGADLIHLRREQPLLHMEGLETYRFAANALTDATQQLLETSGLEVGDIDLFVYHQANSRILRAVADRLGLDDEQRVDTLATTGNTSAASIPLALASTAADGRLRPGSRLLLGAIGAGFVWGTCLLQWGGTDKGGSESGRNPIDSTT